MPVPPAKQLLSRVPINRNAAVLLTAVTLGGCGVYLANAFIDREIASYKAQADGKLEMVEVVVPRRDLPRGTRVHSSDLALREVPADYVQSSALTAANYQVAEGQRLSFDADQGKPLLWSQLEGGKIPTFSGRLPAGLRALTFPVDEISAISGFLQPGDHIDLLLTYRPKNEEITLPLLEQVPVLATGTRTAVDRGATGEETERSYNTVTVQVSPDDAQRIVLAQESGKLTAVLRHPDDRAPMQKTAMTVAKLAADSPKRVARSRAPEPPKEVSKPGVQFIIGGM